VDEGGHRQVRVGAVDEAARRSIAAGDAAAAPEVHRHRPRPLLEEDRRHVAAGQLPDFRPVSGNQGRFVTTAVRK
jgi:hypothetical protein